MLRILKLMEFIYRVKMLPKDSAKQQEQSITIMGVRMILVAFVWLGLNVVTPENVAQFDDRYYSMEVDHEIIQCKLCPPGTYWIEHCSRDGGQPRCQSCPEGRFTMDYNRALYCRKCTKCKGNDKESGEVVAKACTRFHDTKCECKPGYWRKGLVGDCQEVWSCMPGNGAKKLANSHNDTTCEKCVNGKTFSNISSKVTPCQNCSLCLEGWVQKTPCNETQDTVCIPKDEVEGHFKESLIIIPLGVFFGILIAVATIISIYWIRKRIHNVPQKSPSSWEDTDRQENHDEKQVNSPKHDIRQENHDVEEQASLLQQGGTTDKLSVKSQ